MKIVAWMVVKNDSFYVDLALRSVLPFVDGVYIQDQFSDDGTYEKILTYVPTGKVVVERVDTGLAGRFNSGYNEPHFRSLALERAEKVFCESEWLLKLDADEIYTEAFFEMLNDREAQFKKINSFRMSGHRFVTSRHISWHPSAIERNLGVEYIDPHTHLWRRGLGVRYVPNPHMTGFLHCVLNPEPQPATWVSGIYNIHLHRIFGPKALIFWKEGGEEFDESKPFHAPTMTPKWFRSKVNMGTAVEVDFTWPDFILDRWREWGRVW